MPLPYTLPVPPAVAVALGGDRLVECGVGPDGTIRLRSDRPDRSVLAIHGRSPGHEVVIDEAERLYWLAGRGGAPTIVAHGRSTEADEVLLVRLPAAAVVATDPRHGVDPATVASILGERLRDVHQLDPDGAPRSPTGAELRARAAHRVAEGRVEVSTTGPYRGLEPERLLGTLDRLLDELGPGGEVFVHGCPVLENLWLTPEQAAWSTGWHESGVGDPHRDLAVASRSLTERFGAAVVPPFLGSYGLDDVDLRRLDAHQILDHLLG